MNDEWLRPLLEAVETPLRPDADFAASLLDDLRDELGFSKSVAARRVTGLRVEPRARTRTGGRRPLILPLVAALIVTASVGLLATAGAVRDRLAVPPTSVLDGIRQSGRLRIAIRPDHPQYQIGGQAAAGFDVDVAKEIARRLGVAADIVVEDEATMVAPGADGAWDIALPSVPTWAIDSTAFQTSTPYYHWPHYLIVPSAARATTPHDVEAGPICAVAGDAGESWLEGAYGGTPATLVTTSVITRASDADCLAALASGSAIAAVTADLSRADLQVRSDIRAIGGPASEPRAVIVPTSDGTGAGPSAVLVAVDDALAAMRNDGTLTRLSQGRFGGADLSTP